MKNNNIKLIKAKLSKYVKVFYFGNTVCFFNCLSLDKCYFNKSTNSNDKKILNLLEKNNFLSDFDLRAKKFIDSYRKKFKPDFRQLYLVISEACNFNCKYCRQVTHNSRGKKMMTQEETKQIINDFFKQAKNKPQGVVFYGGEPLLNKDVLLETIKYIRQKERELKFKKPTDLTIITNGTNIDNQSARLIKKHNVYIIVSIDGAKKEHDKLRVYKNNHGTFKDVLRGYKIYKSAGCKIGISCTIGSHNYHSLPQVFNYFAKQLKPVNVGINLPHDNYDNPLNVNLDFKLFCQNFLKIFEKSNKNNLYIEHIMRKLNLLFKQEIKVNDCPACGGRLVVLPGKKLGICEGAIGIDNFFFRDIKKTSQMSSAWYLTSPLFDKKCKPCVALGVCGGGCPFDGYLQSKKIGCRDARRCLFIKNIIEWGLYNFYLINKNKIKNKKIFIPSIKNQYAFLKEIKGTKQKLPLRSSAQFSKIKNKFKI